MNKKFSVEDLKSFKKEELYQFAQELKIKGRSKLNKAELISALTPYAVSSLKPLASEKKDNTTTTKISNNAVHTKEETAKAKTTRIKEKAEANPAKRSKAENPVKNTSSKKSKEKKAATGKKGKKDCLQSEAAVKILDRGFAKQKNEEQGLNKKGAEVQPVAVPVEMPIQSGNETPSPRARQIEEERSKKHASLKTTMEIPVFSAPSPETAVPVDEEDLTGDLPADYGETKIVVQVRDPHWAHAYWQIPKSELKRLELGVGIFEFAHSYFVLRVHNVTEGFTHDFKLSENARSHYFYLNKANTVYQAELGLVSPTEGYTFIALSNLVQTPPDTVASVWAIPAPVYARKPFPKEDEQRIAGHELPGIKKATPPLEPIPEITEPELVFGNAFNENHNAESFFNSGVGLQKPVEENLSEHFPESSKMPGSFNDTLHVPGSVPDSSSVLKKSNMSGAPDIFLEARVEVVVYGRTNPENDLNFNGQPVKLDSEGCFSLRLQMPENEQRDVRIEANSPDKNLRREYNASIKLDVD